MKSEIFGPFRRNTVGITCREDVSEDGNVLGGEFLLTRNSTESEDPVFKEIFVVQGPTDNEKNMTVNSATNVKHVSLRMLVAIDAVFGSRIRRQDVAQAYLELNKLLRTGV